MAKKIANARSRINSLWKRKKGIIKKAHFLATCCDQRVFVAIMDKRLARLTVYSSDDNFCHK